ncbi:MAG: trypsin-like peptidase domain-containing protein [Desulfobacterales bacterium]|nr:trypsin-like peptidase domain-containing protein [Desulfobacterales bacterium]
MKTSPGLWVCILLLAALTAQPTSADSGIKSSVVKVYTVFNRPNYHEPWQRVGQQIFHGSGAIIAGERILTNAHVVSDQTFVRVRRAGEARRYTAQVQSVAHESDLAILTVADQRFFQGATPLPIGELPNFQDKVTVYGFPDGGDKLSITEGIVSRIEHSRYAHSGAYLLTCQIDAPINSGNSGGPVMANDRMAGVAFQGISGGDFENIGYMVPAPVVRHFLRDMEDGRHDGTPDLGISLQKLENPDFRKKYALTDHPFGVLVNKVYPDSPATGRLFTEDVLTAIDGENIAEDGTIEFRKGERTFFGYGMQQKQIGESVVLDVWRSGKPLKVRIDLTRSLDAERLVPHTRYDRPPTYFIIGGLVFEPLTLNYIKEYGTVGNGLSLAPTVLLNAYQNEEPETDRRQTVVLVKVLADEINVGYHDFVDTVIARVNDRPISTMIDLVVAFESHTGPYHVVEDTHGFRLVLDRKKVEAVNSEILRRYGIGADRSADLR